MLQILPDFMFTDAEDGITDDVLTCACSNRPTFLSFGFRQ